MNKEISIRPVDITDAPCVQRYASDSALAQTCNVPHPYPVNGGTAFVNRAIEGRKAGKRYAFAVLCDQEFAGIMTLNAVDQEAGTAELDYWIATPFWGMGVATLAAAQVIQFAFTDLNLSRIQSCPLENNVASGRVLEKNGFIQVGEFTNDGLYGSKFLGCKLKRYQLHRDGT